MRILIADDDPLSRAVLEKSLSGWGHETVSVSDGIQAWVALHRESRPSIAILDWLMPGLDGVKICGKLREESSGNYVYVIILTGKNQRKNLIQALAQGADDFVSKPFEPAELQARLQVAKRIIDLETQLIAAREAMKEEATNDPLTGTWNRRMILRFLDQEMARGRRERFPVATILLDLDHFKQVNDRHGHLAGDETLREFVRRVKSVVRPYDAIGRYGGEEFLLVLPRCEAAGAAQLSERILPAIGQEPFLTRKGPIAVTVSAGISTSEASGLATPEEMIHAADLALYRAKRAGRNRAEVAPEPGPGPNRTHLGDIGLPASAAEAWAAAC
ncbi:MAG: GGDEF domain-containing response regulator [Thermoanaerobaculia bacterium]